MMASGTLSVALGVQSPFASETIASTPGSCSLLFGCVYSVSELHREKLQRRKQGIASRLIKLHTRDDAKRDRERDGDRCSVFWWATIFCTPSSLYDKCCNLSQTPVLDDEQLEES